MVALRIEGKAGPAYHFLLGTAKSQQKWTDVVQKGAQRAAQPLWPVAVLLLSLPMPTLADRNSLSFSDTPSIFLAHLRCEILSHGKNSGCWRWLLRCLWSVVVLWGFSLF